MNSLLNLFSIFGIIDCWRDSWRAYREETFQKFVKILTKSSLEAPKLRPGASKIEPGALQDAIFLRTLNLRRLERSCSVIFWRPKSQLGSTLEAPNPAKSKPKGEKIDVEKLHTFELDFGRVQAWFWKGFWKVFKAKNARFWQMHVFRENLKNINFIKEKLIFSRT